jgi:hypothetical protein
MNRRTVIASGVIAVYGTGCGAAGGAAGGHMSVPDWLVVAAIFPVAFALAFGFFILIDRWL